MRGKDREEVSAPDPADVGQEWENFVDVAIHFGPDAQSEQRRAQRLHTPVKIASDFKSVSKLLYVRSHPMTLNQTSRWLFVAYKYEYIL